jgi:hypothetical protein
MEKTKGYLWQVFRSSNHFILQTADTSCSRTATEEQHCLQIYVLTDERFLAGASLAFSVLSAPDASGRHWFDAGIGDRGRGQHDRRNET